MERYASGGSCPSCSVERTMARRNKNPLEYKRYQKSWLAENPSYGLLYARRNSKRIWATTVAYFQKNPEKYRAKVAKARQAAAIRRKKNPEKYRALNRIWAKKNPEKVFAYANSWRKRNPEKARMQHSSWQKKNPEEYRVRRASWRKRNPPNKARAKARAKDAAKRARKIQATPPWLTKEHKAEIAAIYRRCPPGHQVDHIVPLRGKTVCGLHVPWNLQILTKYENLKKGNKLLV